MSMFSESKRQWLVVLSLMAFVFTVGFFTLPAQRYEGDPRAWRHEARSLLLTGRLNVDPAIADAIGRPGQFFVTNVADGKSYSKYGVFNTLLNSVPLAGELIATGELSESDQPQRIFILGCFFCCSRWLLLY